MLPPFMKGRSLLSVQCVKKVSQKYTVWRSICHVSMNKNNISSAMQLLFTYVYNSCLSKARLEKKPLCIVSWECIKNSSENQTYFFLFAGKSWAIKMIPKLPVMVWNEIQSELCEGSQIRSKNRDRTKLWFFQIFKDSLNRQKLR